MAAPLRAPPHEDTDMNTTGRLAAFSSAVVLLLALDACEKKTESTPAAAASAPATSGASTPSQATGEGEDDHGEGPEVGRRLREQHAPGAGLAPANTPSDTR